jgi:NADPH:quinone reductase
MTTSGMNTSIPKEMKAAAIEHFGGPEVIRTRSLPVPTPEADEVLIRLDTAGIGVWDPYVREGQFELGKSRFPLVIGNDGAGTVVAVGSDVERLRPGDRVYSYTMEGGMYAEYAAVKQQEVAPLPKGLDAREAGALGADGVTALLGLQDHLHLQPEERLMILGASGGIGHIAVQLAKRMGAYVFAVASGEDGVELVRSLGADAAVDGRREDVVRAALEFAPEGLDAALVLTGADGLSEEVLSVLKAGGRAAYPNGVEPEPEAPSGVTLTAYDGLPSREAFERLNSLIEMGSFHVELGRVYDLADAAQAHRELGQHHLGKLAFNIHHS